MGTRFTPSEFDYYRHGLNQIKLSPQAKLVTVSFDALALRLVVSDGFIKWTIGVGSTSREILHHTKDDQVEHST